MADCRTCLGLLRKLIDRICADLTRLECTFVSEVKIGGHLAALMIPSQHMNSTFVLDFDRKDQSQNLYGERSSVYIVSQEQVLGVLNGSADFVLS